MPSFEKQLGISQVPIDFVDAKGMPLGIEMAQASRQGMLQAFYLNKLNLPQRAPEMTAHEVGQRIQEYIRGALPIFEPMENERNGQLWERTFKLMMRHRSKNYQKSAGQHNPNA